MLNISHEKQSLIMAQSSTRLAVEIAISINKPTDFTFIKKTAHELFKIETGLAGFHIEKIKELSKDSREKTIEEMLKNVKSVNDVHQINTSLTTDEQIKYKPKLQELLNKINNGIL